MTASANTQHQHADDESRHTTPMMRRNDTAAYLAVSKRTLDRLVQAGEIPRVPDRRTSALSHRVTIQVPIQRWYAAIRREVSGSALMSMSRSAIS